MRAAIYNPYLDTLGGGEQYTMGIAETLGSAGYQVDIQWQDLQILKKLEERFGIKRGSENIRVIEDIARGDGYDLCFWVSDGSIPLLRSRNNLLHFQVPFQGVGGRSLINKMKLFRIKEIVCNSEFTKSFIDREYGVDSKVVYPPVNVSKFRSKRKENLILYVGRFSKLNQAKRQDILVKAFKDLFDEIGGDWRLVLAGGIEIGVGEHLDELKAQVESYPVEFVESPSFRELQELYGRTKIFWSAAGYGVDETADPARVEHFGITVVEAMAAGAVPLVYGAGGHKEIVNEDLLWLKRRELLQKTKEFISDNKLTRRKSSQMKTESKRFSKEIFQKNILSLI